MIEQRDHVLWHKANGALRFLLAHSVTRLLPLYVVNEYPKSGGTWVAQMLSDALQVPFPRNRLPMLRPSILHGHTMIRWNMHNLVIVWRDGRDVLVSQYYHWLFKNERNSARVVAAMRGDLGFSDYEDVTGNLPAFMEYVFQRKGRPRMSWTDFAATWLDHREAVHVRYEDLRRATAAELRRIVRALTGRELDASRADEIAAARSFERMSGRPPGTEDPTSFMRKGIVGDWRNCFDRRSRERFHAYAGDVLVKLGYERDDSWVREGT